jgi:glutathione S-transferase
LAGVQIEVRAMSGNTSASLPRLKLTYFDFDGGRGEAARLTLAIAGIEFDDCRIPLKAWADHKEQMPFHALPVLQVDGEEISQSNTINRYLGKLTNLYPADPWQAALCDEVMDAIEDIGTQIVATFSIKDDTRKKAARDRLAGGPIPLYLARLDSELERRGGEYFADNRLTVADLKAFVWIRHLRSGALDYIPTDLPDRMAPLLLRHFERLNGDRQIRAYYEKRRISRARS